MPMRKCLGCNEMKPKNDLIRIVRSPDKKNIFQDKSGKSEGRGAYICKDIACLKKAQHARRFEKAFSCKMSEDFYKNIDVYE